MLRTHASPPEWISVLRLKPARKGGLRFITDHVSDPVPKLLFRDSEKHSVSPAGIGDFGKHPLGLPFAQLEQPPLITPLAQIQAHSNQPVTTVIVPIGMMTRIRGKAIHAPFEPRQPATACNFLHDIQKKER